MNSHPGETPFLTGTTGYDDADERQQVERSIAQVQRDQCCVKRFASVTALVPLLAMAVLGFETMSQKNVPYEGSHPIISVLYAHPVIRVLCEIGLAPVICLVAFAGLLMGYRKKVNRLRDQCRPLATRLEPPHLLKPDIETSPGGHPGSEAPGTIERAAEVTGYQGRLDSPSWRSNRLCG
jgi:hypothetical protein